MKKRGIDPRSLSAQMILGFFALVLLTALAAGLPAIWLIRDQLVDQAWAQVEQGRRVSQALYKSRQSEISQLATLTAQRPTLRELLAGEDWPDLPAYLRTLRAGAGLDVALVCDSAGRPISQGYERGIVNVCAANAEGVFHIVSTISGPKVRLLAAQSVQDTSPGLEPGFRVVVGIDLNDTFAVQMRDQTGLEHAVLIGGEPVATSLAGGASVRGTCEPLDPSATGGECRITYDHDGAPYYAARFPLNDQGLVAETALPVSDIVAAQRRLVGTLAGAILVIAAVGSGVGAFLARRIGKPLYRLTDAASALSKGDLSSPVAVDARVREVALVATALEGARIDLQRTLGQLRHEKAWTDHLLEAIVEGIVTLDRRGRVTYFSQGAEQITGWKRDQVLGCICDQVFQPLETDKPFSQLIPAPGRRRKIPVALCDGRQAILSVTGAPLLPPEGGDARVALVFRDVSEEEAVHKLLGHFLANVAHEFRTPLASVAASVELLLDQTPDLNSEELGELLTALHLGVLGLQTLVDNLLEGASIEAGHFRVSARPADLSEILAEAIRTTRPLLEKRGQRLIVELPAAIPVVQADPRRTIQVLVNLLSNASKYGPDEAQVVIGAAVLGDYVRVIVADRGPGIPPEQQQDVFRRFTYLGMSNDKAQYGVGLGLSVVKAIVEAHGGQVGVENRPGGGSIFWFTVPKMSD